MARKYSIIILVLLVALAACSVKPRPLGHMLGKKTPLILEFEFEVNEHVQHHEKEFWIKNRGTYHISY